MKRRDIAVGAKFFVTVTGTVGEVVDVKGRHSSMASSEPDRIVVRLVGGVLLFLMPSHLKPFNP